MLYAKFIAIAKTDTRRGPVTPGRPGVMEYQLAKHRERIGQIEITEIVDLDLDGSQRAKRKQLELGAIENKQVPILENKSSSKLRRRDRRTARG